MLGKQAHIDRRSFAVNFTACLASPAPKPLCKAWDPGEAVFHKLGHWATKRISNPGVDPDTAVGFDLKHVDWPCLKTQWSGSLPKAGKII